MTKLSNIIAPSFYDTYYDVTEGRHTYYDLYGGRGSTKSSFVSAMIILGMLQDEQASACIFRKVALTLRDSVYNQIQWAIDKLGLTAQFEAFISPMQFVYIPTGQVISFKGLDKAKKTKSVKCPHGYYKYLWFEELDEFANIEEIRTVQQSYLRGGEGYVVFKTFNPPISANNWANEYVATPSDRSYRLRTDYTTVPDEWLGEDFIRDAEELKKNNPKAYKHEYLGEAVGLGTDIFDRIEVREISDKEIENMERIYQGQDWGWAPDPKAFIRCSYNHQQQKLYLIDEYGGCKIRVDDMASEIKKRGYNDAPVYCGADELESIDDYRRDGLDARRVDNRPGSVKYEMEWLQCRTIVIDPKRTPNAYREIINYNYDVDSHGNIIDRYPDRDNHYIDAIRYATSTLALKKTANVKAKPTIF